MELIMAGNTTRKIKKRSLKTLLILGRNKGLTWFTHFIDRCFPFIYKIHSAKFMSAVMGNISGSMRIVSPLETLKIIETAIEQHKRGVYMRFGDGDVLLALGKSALLHKSTKMLS